MNTVELETFISKRMSKSHIYQPAVLTVLLENEGRASSMAIAERCSSITGGSVGDIEKSLLKYPKEALTKSGVVAVDNKEFQLSCPFHLIDKSQLEQLLKMTRDALNRFSKSTS